MSENHKKAGRKARKVSPWGKGPHCTSKRAREMYEQYRIRELKNDMDK